MMFGRATVIELAGDPERASCRNLLQSWPRFTLARSPAVRSASARRASSAGNAHLNGGLRRAAAAGVARTFILTADCAGGRPPGDRRARKLEAPRADNAATCAVGR